MLCRRLRETAVTSSPCREARWLLIRMRHTLSVPLLQSSIRFTIQEVRHYTQAYTAAFVAATKSPSRRATRCHRNPIRNIQRRSEQFNGDYLLEQPTTSTPLSKIMRINEHWRKTTIYRLFRGVSDLHSPPHLNHLFKESCVH